MFRSLLLVCAGLVLWAADGGRVWVERDGLVAIECEHADPNGWAVETTVPGFLGGGYLHHTGSGKEIAYQILITTPGIYRITIRNFHDHPDSTLENDCFLGVDDGPMVKCFSGIKDTWNWASTMDAKHRKYPPLWDLNPGLHRIRISGRSTGFRVDRIHCFLEGKTAGAEDSHPESSVLPHLVGLSEDGVYAKAYALGAAGPLLKAAEGAKPDDAEGQRVREACLAEIDARRRVCADLRAQHPLGAAEALALVGQLWSPSAAGRDLISEAKAWAKTPEAKQEAKARAIQAQVEATARRLIDLEVRADDPKAKAYARDLMTIATAAKVLEKDHAGSRQAETVRGWCRILGIPE